jgi:circadian clock protein KaiC
MTPAANTKGAIDRVLPKSSSGIRGLDEITGGGLPKGRPTLICGSAGCGKTLMATEFLVRGATEYNEPGVFVAFEETAEELTQNVRSLGFDLDDLVERNELFIDHVHVDRSEIEETGEYDLEGLFIRVGCAIDSIGAKRIVLDTIETLFSGFSDQAILRSELRRLFRWLKDKGMTAVITAERGGGTLTRNGLEEYVSDCVILLDHRSTEQISTRRLRVVKYRGTLHATNEFPFVIEESGISVLPVTSLGLDHEASEERISSGVARLDAMLGGEGYYRGSSILISGTAGTGKTSLAAHLADATCRRGERCLYLAFEESQSQMVRNMRSIGLDLAPWIGNGLLRFHATRPTLYGLETHLANIHKTVDEFRPQIVIIDPISNLVAVGNLNEVQAMFVRLLDYLKMNQITAFLTNLTSAKTALESTEVGLSSLIDTWLLARDIELNGERNRGLYVLKSRGMEHSNQIREFRIGAKGIDLIEVYLGPEGVLTGSARVAQEARVRATAALRRQQIERSRRDLAGKRKALEAQISALREEFDTYGEELQLLLAEEQIQDEQLVKDRLEMARSRKADAQEGLSRLDQRPAGANGDNHAVRES